VKEAFAAIPAWLIHLFTLWFGLMVGSFVNVLIVRLPAGESIAWPGSRCPKCRTPIRWCDNLPVLSYMLFLRGKCRACKEPISARYPLVELLTGGLFLAAEMRFGWSLALGLRDLPIIAMLVAVTFIDLDHRIIPDKLSLGGLVLALVTTVGLDLIGLGSPISWSQSLIGGAVGFSLFYGLAWTYWRLTGRSGLGGGDVKLLALLGAFLGVGGVFATIMISSIFGSIVGIGSALWARTKAPAEGEAAPGLLQASIPYGPFLVLGGLYYYLLGDILWFRFMSPM
jgi:leader peptidase (prepilin peptidase)/N-methyltransferase